MDLYRRSDFIKREALHTGGLHGWLVTNARDFVTPLRILIFAVACFLLPIAPHESSAAQILQGTLDGISGDVKIQRRGSVVVSPGVSGMRVGPGDAVSTGSTGRAGVIYEHGRLDLADATRIVILRCASSVDEVYAEVALPFGAVTATINMERGKEHWFDIVTRTSHMRGRGGGTGSRLSVSQPDGGEAVTDSSAGRWQTRPVLISDEPPAVRAALKNDVRSSGMIDQYLDGALDRNILRSFKVEAIAGLPNFGAASPENTLPPAIKGDAKIGAVLTCDPGAWSGDPTITYQYRWYRDGQEITGATTQTYNVVEADGLHEITCHVTAANTGGQNTAATAAVSIPVAKPANTTSPAITGDAKISATLSASSGTWSGDPTITYQ